MQSARRSGPPSPCRAHSHWALKEWQTLNTMAAVALTKSQGINGHGIDLVVPIGVKQKCLALINTHVGSAYHFLIRSRYFHHILSTPDIPMWR